VKVILEATDYEMTELIGVQARLLKVTETVIASPAVSIRSTFWVNERGDVFKTQIEALNLTTYRVGKDFALAEFDPASLDLIAATVVRPGRRLPPPHSLQSVTYRIRLKNADPAAVFGGDTRQEVMERINEHEVMLRVTAGDREPAGDPQDTPTDADREPCALIESNDPRVQALADRVAADEEDAAALARALAELVHQEIERKDFSQAIASAAETAKSKQGDCTEHAVLLAALCRARGIPARVVMGLVYYPPLEGFAYHMWTEAWTGGDWLPLDATDVVGPVGPGHLAITADNLAGASPVSAFLPVAQVMGQLEIQVEEAAVKSSHPQ
jgi:transglutaminase-like putative cysteine protease